MITRWTNRTSWLTIENLMVDENGHLEISNEDRSTVRLLKSLDGLVITTPEEVALDLEVKVNSTGYSDPGRIGGRVEDSYPPEGEDERTVVEAQLLVYSIAAGPIPVLKVIVPKERYGGLGDDLADEIEALEIDTSPPERDDDDDRDED